MKRDFEIRLERQVEDDGGCAISLRFYSQGKVVLYVKDAKAYYDEQRFDEDGFIKQVKLDNSFEVKTFCFGSDKKREYSSLNFIVKDKINCTQFAVKVPLNGENVEYKRMTYEGTP